MLSLFTPLWLVGLIALAVPLVLHLWNRRPTTVVRIGSLRGLTGPPGPRALGRRLDDIPLLLLRLAVLAAVVLGLAGLAVQRVEAGAGGLSVLLVDPLLLDDSIAVFSDPAIDSLRRSGEPLRLLGDGFPRLGEPSSPGGPESIWALVRQLDDTLPAGSRVTVLAALTAGRLGPLRPHLRSIYEFRSIESPTPSRLANRPGDSLYVEVVVGQGYETEAKLVSAAWASAVEAHTGVAPRVVESHAEGATAHHDTDILIWLADQSVSRPARDRIASGATLVEFLTGEPHPVLGPEIITTPTSGAPTGLFREAVWLRSAVPEGTPVISDGSGQPLVTVEALGQGAHYRVATRLAADWSTLGLGADLPELALLTLRGHRTGVEAAKVYPSQARTRLRSPTPEGTSRWQALSSWAVLLAALLLAAERLIVHGRLRAEAA